MRRVAEGSQKIKNKGKMKNFYTGRDILVTGGCGSIGSEIVRRLLSFNPSKVRVFDNSEEGHFRLNQKLKSDRIRSLVGDVRDKNRLRRAVRGADIVFHAAALKHVDLCEYNPDEAIYTNVIGTKNLVDAATDENVAKFIGISTDKAVNPISTMGATKLLGEKLIINAPHQVSKTMFSVVRFGNVLNSSGSVIPIFRNQIKEGGPITITSKDMVRFFIKMNDAIGLIFKAAEIMKGNEIFILKMKALRIADLAQVMAEELAPKYGRNPKDITFKIIGTKKGEKTNESLMTNEEAEHASIAGNLLIIKPQLPNSYGKTASGGKKPDDFEYNSINAKVLSKEEIRKMIPWDEI